MKKNLLSVLILALLIVNIVLTGVMLVSITGTNKKTANLVGNISTVLNLELDDEVEGAKAVSLADTYVFQLGKDMMVPLAADEAGNTGYLMFDISLFENTKHEDYEKSSPLVSTNAAVLIGEVESIISKHTVDDCRNNLDQIRAEILRAIQKLFDGSDFIYDVSISSVKYG